MDAGHNPESLSPSPTGENSTEETFPNIPDENVQTPSEVEIADADMSNIVEKDMASAPPTTSTKDCNNEDDGHISDEDDLGEIHGEPKMEGLESINSSPSSSDVEDEKLNAKSRLEKLKNMRFSGTLHKKFSPGAPQRRTVRSFLDEKLAPDDSDVSHCRSRKRTPSPDDERDRHHRRKRRHDDEDRDRRKDRSDRGHTHTVNPQTITQKVQTILARCEGPCDIPEDDLRSIVLETVMLEQELHGMFEKRQNLAKEMEEMAAQERETIKKVHSSLPAHMQTVLKFEGDNIGINDAPVLNPAMAAIASFPPGMFPPIPSMLKAGMPPFPPGMPLPPIGPNGMPIFPFPGMTFPENRSSSPGAEVPEIKNGQQTPPEQVQWSSGSVPKSEAQPGSPFDIAWSSSANFSGSFHEVPPVSGEPRPIDFSKPPPLTNSNNGSSSNLPDMAVPPPMSSFNMPPPTFSDGENASAPYQTSAIGRPTFPGQMQGSDLCKTITSLITNAIKAPSSFNSPPPSLLNTNIRVPSSGGSSSPMMPVRPNPPSLMSIPTKDPFHLGTMRIGSSGGFGKGGHRKKTHGGRGGRELRDHTASPR